MSKSQYYKLYARGKNEDNMSFIDFINKNVADETVATMVSDLYTLWQQENADSCFESTYEQNDIAKNKGQNNKIQVDTSNIDEKTAGAVNQSIADIVKAKEDAKRASENVNKTTEQLNNILKATNTENTVA